MLNDPNLGFHEKIEVLSWFVDSMRTECLNYFEPILQEIDEQY